MRPRSEIRSAAIGLLLLQPRLDNEYSLYFLNYAGMNTGGRAVLSSYSAKNDAAGSLSEVKGSAIPMGNFGICFYDRDTYPSNETKRTIAHELGHIFLGHRIGNDPTEEREADIFSDEFTVPECVVYYLDERAGRYLSPEELSLYFPADVSRLAARRRELILSKQEREYTENEKKLLSLLFGKSK